MDTKHLIIFLLFQISFFYAQKNENQNLVKVADSLEQVEKLDESIIIWEKLSNNQQDVNHNFYLGKYFYVKGLIDGHQNGNYDTAIINFNKAELYFLKCKPTKKLKKLISNTYLEVSYCYWDWDKALIANRKGYNYTLKNIPNDLNIIEFLVDQGDIYRRINKYELSILSFEKALKKIYKITPDDYEQLGYVHNLLGVSYSNLHFHNQSLYHYSKGLEFNSKDDTTDKAYLVNSATNVIWENLDYGDDKKAKEIMSFLNKIFYKWYYHKDFATTDAGSLKDYNLHFKGLYYLSNLRSNVLYKKVNLAKTYLDSISFIFNKYPEKRKKIDNTLLLARHSFEKTFESTSKENINEVNKHINFIKKTIELARFSESKHEALVASLQLANAYNKYHKYEEALKVIEDSKKIDETFFNASRFSIEVLEAEVLNSLNKTNNARTVFLNSYQKLLEKQKKTTNLNSLKYADFKKFNSGTFIRNVINSANTFFKLYEKEKSKKDLIISNNLYFIASDMFAEFYQKGKYNYSLNAFNKEIASGLIQTQLLIDPNDDKKIKEILNKIENNSSQHLWNIFEIKNSQNLKVPSFLIQEYNQLIFEKNNILTQQEVNNKSIENKNRLTVLENKIIEIQKKINQYDTNYQKFKSTDFKVENVQNQLSSNQLMIKYIVTNKKTFALAITKDKIDLIEIGHTNQLKTIVSENRKLISTINIDYKKSAKLLYNKLIQPIIKDNKSKSIIFIPEDFLNTVSFESLQNSKGRFLTQSHLVSYAYSIKLWDFLQQNNNLKNQNNQFVSFAPNYAKIPKSNQVRGLRRGNLFDLAEAKTEAQTISNLFNGKLFLNENATKNNFLQSTTTYNFHHLAMHSILEQDYSKSSLVFSNNKKVYFDELYQLNFPSKMVVLSACSTGLGIQESGEGIMSLSRALAYSGVKSSVYSLWQVPDKETSEIMISFYENLKKGQSKDEALANAKTSFIKKNPMKNHPFYWAGFIVNGDVSPIISNSNWILYVGIGLAFLLLIFLFRKKLFQFQK